MENVLTKLYNKLDTPSWRRMLGDRVIDKIGQNSEKVVLDEEDSDLILKQFTVVLLKSYEAKICNELNTKRTFFYKDSDLEDIVNKDIFTLDELYKYPATERERMFFDDEVFEGIVNILNIRKEI